ncbi:unnamed protein product, partial [Musa textilis]
TGGDKGPIPCRCFLLPSSDHFHGARASEDEEKEEERKGKRWFPFVHLQVLVNSSFRILAMGGAPRPDLVGTAPPGFPPLPKSAASSAAPSEGASSVESSLPGGGFGAIAGQEEPEEAKPGRPRGYGCDGSEASIHKRRRGGPPGSRRLGEWIVTSAGVGFTPHVMMMTVGENISEKIMSFSKQGPRAVFILSAYGAVSTVTLHKPGTSGIMVTYEV